jgi:hypothetical protein
VIHGWPFLIFTLAFCCTRLKLALKWAYMVWSFIPSPLQQAHREVDPRVCGEPYWDVSVTVVRGIQIQAVDRSQSFSS